MKVHSESSGIFKMAVNKLRLTSFKLLKYPNFYNSCVITQKNLYCTAKSENEEVPTLKKLGFAEFSEKQDEFLKPKPTSTESFVSLLRNSKFIDIGDPVGKIVIGEIYHVVGRDLYIDFGWKFPTVCTSPEKKKELFVPGAKVKLLIKDLEVTAKFLGQEESVTLNEADCVLLGLARPQNKNRKSKFYDLRKEEEVLYSEVESSKLTARKKTEVTELKDHCLKYKGPFCIKYKVIFCKGLLFTVRSQSSTFWLILNKFKIRANWFDQRSEVKGPNAIIK